MIVSTENHPELDLYYLGAQLIEVLENNKNNTIEYFTLFEQMKRKVPISINLFALALDWLFLIDVVKNEEGCISKCF